MRVLIADKLASFVSGRLQDLSCEVVVEPALKGEQLTERLRQLNPEALVVRSTQVKEADLRASSSLALVIRAGAGVNTIDLQTASAMGVYVANCPGKNAAAVAELAIGHLINLDRRLADNVSELRAGRWNKAEFGKALGLRGRTLAVIGLGRIGEATAAIALAMGMKVIAWSRSLSDERAEALGIERAASPEAAVTGAHAVSVHLALTPETRGRVGRSVFEAMPPNSYFINTSRAEVVDEAALAQAIKSKEIRAGLDVFEGEPAAKQGPFEGGIIDNSNVYGTHHIGASTQQAEDAVGEEVIRIVGAYKDGHTIPNCVNLSQKTDATHVMVVRHADRVGVLAAVLDALRKAEHNVEDMQNIVFSGGKAACARIALVNQPSPETISDIVASDAIFSVTVSAIASGQ